MASDNSGSSTPSVARELLTLAGTALVLLVTGFVFAPATVYLFNGNEVTTPLADVLRNAGVWPLVILAAVVGFGVLGRRAGRRLLAAVLLALAALLYLQGNVLVWQYGVFNGTEIDWSRHQMAGWFEIVVWSGVLIGAVIGHRRLWRHLPRLALILALLNVASLGAQRLAGRTFEHATASGIDDQLFRFSSRQNVVIVVMDAFAAPAFDRILAADPSWRDKLAGFTYYHDALGVAPTTLPSIPALLSGLTADNSQTVAEYLRGSLGGVSLPRVLQENGFQTHTITETIYGKYLADVPYASQISFLDSRPRNRQRRDARRIWNVALFRYTPHVIKRRVYAEGRWLLRDSEADAKAGAIPQPPYSQDEANRVPSPGQRASWIIWQEMMANAAVGADRPTYKFIHTFETHTPFFRDENGVQLTQQQYVSLGAPRALIGQSTGAMKQVLAFLGKLRELGIYDKTLVILTADHGSHTPLLGEDDGDADWERIPGVTKVLPLLLVKPAGATGPLRVSQAQVSLLDIANTVTSESGLGHLFPGRALADTPEGEDRVRTYFDYTWEHSYWWEDYLPPLTRYTVAGPAREPASWSVGVPLPTGGQE